MKEQLTLILKEKGFGAPASNRLASAINYDCERTDISDLIEALNIFLESQSLDPTKAQQ